MTDEQKRVEQTVQALGKAWDKWPIITASTAVALSALAVLAYTMYRLFTLFETFGCA